MKLTSWSHAISAEEAIEHSMTLKGNVFIFTERENIMPMLEALDEYEETFDLQRRDWRIYTPTGRITMVELPTNYDKFTLLYAGLNFQHIVTYDDYTRLLPPEDRRKCTWWMFSRMRA